MKPKYNISHWPSRSLFVTVFPLVSRSFQFPPRADWPRDTARLLAFSENIQLYVTKMVNKIFDAKVILLTTGHLRYLEIKGNGETTSSFAKFEIGKLRPANVLRKSQLFHILRLSGSPFHHVYHIDSDFKHIFPDLTHDFKTFFNNFSDERLCVDIKDRFLTWKV